MLFDNAWGPTPDCRVGIPGGQIPMGESPCGNVVAMGIVTVLGLSVLMVPARADEEKIPVEKLPAAVQKAIKSKFPKAEIERASKEVEDGKTIYEVELEIKDRSVDVAFKADGTILEIEREVPFDEVPKAVKKKLAAKYPKAKIEKVEEVTKGEDGPVHYEVAITTEVVLTAKGKIVKAEEEEDDEDRPRKPRSPRRKRTRMTMMRMTMSMTTRGKTKRTTMSNLW